MGHRKSKKEFYDLGVHRWIIQGSRKMLDVLLTHLNMTGIAIIHEIKSASEISKLKAELKKIARWKEEYSGNKSVFRNVVIKTQSLTQTSVKSILSKIRSSTEIITLECLTPSMTKWAINDRRIDLLSFPPQHIKSLLDVSAVRLIKEHEKYVEISMNHFINILPSQRISTFRKYLEAFRRIRKKDSRIILTSHAKNPLEMRNAVQLRSFLKILGFNDDETELIIHHNPTSIIKRNLEKLNPNYILPGLQALTIEEFINQLQKSEQLEEEEE